MPPIPRRQMRGLPRGLRFDELAGNERCVELLRSYAEDSPRRLKRFLLWHEPERRSIDLVEGLRWTT